MTTQALQSLNDLGCAFNIWYQETQAVHRNTPPPHLIMIAELRMYYTFNEN